MLHRAAAPAPVSSGRSGSAGSGRYRGAGSQAERACRMVASSTWAIERRERHEQHVQRSRERGMGGDERGMAGAALAEQGSTSASSPPTLPPKHAYASLAQCA